MYAIVQTGGKQYKVEPGDLLKVEKLTGDPGAEVERIGKGTEGDPGPHRQQREADRVHGQMWMTRPIESSAASAIASDRVGWAWMARSTSSTVYSFSRATVSSWIISDA